MKGKKNLSQHSDMTFTPNGRGVLHFHDIMLLEIKQYFALFLFSRSIKKLFSIDYVNIFLFPIFFSIDFGRWKSVGLSHITYIY